MTAYCTSEVVHTAAGCYLRTAPNEGLEPTPASVRCAPAFRRGSLLALERGTKADGLRRTHEITHNYSRATSY
jgi:hypothetical protein